jgi:hypothetical protein
MKDGTKRDQQILRSILAAAELLWGKHQAEIREMLTTAQQTGRVSFSVKIDESLAEPTVTTQIRFAAVVSESVTARFSADNQETFEFVNTDAETAQEADVDGPPRVRMQYAMADCPPVVPKKRKSRKTSVAVPSSER